jgi:hypothetical protein
MSDYSIRATHNDYAAVYQGEQKVAIIFPADNDGKLALYPNPDAFPGLMFEGRPAALRPEFEPFESLEAIAERFGIQPEAIAA